MTGSSTFEASKEYEKEEGMGPPNDNVITK